MKPAGIERDKLIAEMKGYKVSYRARKWRGKPIEKWYISRIEKGILITKTLPHYSTSWLDAKELWDELPTIRGYEMSGSLCYHRVWYLNPKDMKNYSFEGKNFPDAVSQPWIIYMRGKRYVGSFAFYLANK